MKKILGSLVILVMTSLTLFAQSQSREDLLKEIEAKRAELLALEKQFLSPSEEDRATYAEFLRQPETGLIRLLPREKYDTEGYTDKKRAIIVRGGGAYYSFTKRTHEYGNGTEISLQSNHFVSAFWGNQAGSFTDLGHVPIESVSLETPEAVTLLNANLKGRSRVPVTLNSTYLVRSVDNLDKDHPSPSDTLAAFRVVRIDNDGSAVILWKILKKYQAPDVTGNQKKLEN